MAKIARAITKKTVNRKKLLGPKDFKEATYKFPPIPNDKFMQILRSLDSKCLYAGDIDFLAVCEFETDGEMYEQLCFIVFDNYKFFDILTPDSVGCANHVAFARIEVDTHEGEPVYKWDKNRLWYYHPTAGAMPEKQGETDVG